MMLDKGAIVLTTFKNITSLHVKSMNGIHYLLISVLVKQKSGCGQCKIMTSWRREDQNSYIGRYPHEKYYIFSREELTWNEAKRKCQQQRSASLLTFFSEHEEEQFIHNFTKLEKFNSVSYRQDKIDAALKNFPLMHFLDIQQNEPVSHRLWDILFSIPFVLTN